MPRMHRTAPMIVSYIVALVCVLLVAHCIAQPAAAAPARVTPQLLADLRFQQDRVKRVSAWYAMQRDKLDQSRASVLTGIVMGSMLAVRGGDPKDVLWWYEQLRSVETPMALQA